MATPTEDRPNIEEAYASATNTSDLKIDTLKQRPIDSIIAAGWSYSRIGAALLRLHSEWDGAEKPQKASPEQLELLAETFHKEKNGLVKWKEKLPSGEESVVELKPLEAAKRQAAAWYLHELGLLFQKLKTLQEVRHQLKLWCGRVGIAGEEHKVAAVIGWWLDPTCTVCEGQGWQLMAGTRRLSNRVCETCQGSRELRIPYGQDGRKMLGFMNDCLSAARSSMRGRFKHQQGGE